MATTTQNLGLIKPAGTDKIRISQINSNMDTIDAKMGPVGSTPLQTQATNAAASISASQRSIAIIVDGDTAGATVAPGQYAYLKNNTHGLAEGLYQNTSNAAFPASGGTANSTVFTVVPGGLGSEFTSLNSNTVKKTDRVAIDRNVDDSLDDCNNATEVGFYRIIVTTANRPSWEYGILFTMRSNDYITQIGVSISGTLSVRGRINNWTEWRTVTFT